MLRENIAPQDLERCGDELIPVRQGHISVGDKLFRMFATFERLKQSNQNNQFAFADLKSAFRSIHERELPDDLLKAFARDYLAKQNSAISLSRSSSSESPDDEGEHTLPRKQFKKRNSKVVKVEKLSKSTISKLEKIELNLEQFYCVMSELYRMLESREMSQNIENTRTLSNLLAAKLNSVLRSVKTVSSQVKAVFVTTTGNGHHTNSPQMVKFSAKQVARSRIAYSTRGTPTSASLHSSRTSLFDVHEVSGRPFSPMHRHSLVSGLTSGNASSNTGTVAGGNAVNGPLTSGSIHKHAIHHAKHLPHSPKSAAFSPNSGSQKQKFSTSNISVSTSSLASSILYNTDKSLYIAGIVDEAYMDQVPLLK